MRVTTLVLVCLALIVGLMPVSGAFAADVAATKTKAAAATKTAEKKTVDPKKTDKFEQGALTLPKEAKSKKAADKVKTSKKGSVGRMMFGLAFVLLVIYGVHWLLKKVSSSKIPSLSASAGISGLIEVVSTTPLAANRNLHLVRIGGDLVLIGATENSITQLQTVDAGALQIAAGNAGNAEFQSALNGAMTSSSSTSNNGTFLQRVVSNMQLLTSR